MLRRQRQPQRGDTLIEVLFAVSIFSAVVVGTIIIMNQGISSAQNALEINLVRNQIDTQAELLRHLNNAKLTSIGRNATNESAEWDKAVGQGAAAGNAAYRPDVEAQNYSSIATFEDCRPQSLPNNAFFIDPKSGQIQRKNRIETTTTFAQVQSATGSAPSLSNMLWVQPVSSASDSSNSTLTLTQYYDFHVRACWDSPGAGGGVMKLGTIVRLYVPRT
jgi:type II secretory pathway pseudopilin PulG